MLAEGIETEEPCARPAALGVDRGQGWLFGRPAGTGSVRGMLCRAGARSGGHLATRARRGELARRLHEALS